jgi:hypothetical protein
MRRRLVAALAGTLVLPLASAPAWAGERIVPAQIAQARYVALGYDLGDRFTSETEAIANPDVLPEERRALVAIADEIRRWGRYVVTVHPRDAELLIAVRIGRRGSIGGGIGVGTPQGGSPVPGGPIGGVGSRGGGRINAELSSNADMLSVYDSAGGGASSPLWRVQRDGGLQGEPPRLFQEFRADVDRAPAPETTEKDKKVPEKSEAPKP